MSMFLKGKANKWMVSGEDTQQLSIRAYELLRTGNGYYSGQQLGEILYKHYHKGYSVDRIKKDNHGIARNILKAIIKGTYAPKTFIVYMDLAENEPETLEAIYSDVKEGEGIG